jgi:hypothetical protein
VVKEIITVCCEDLTKYINNLSGEKYQPLLYYNLWYNGTAFQYRTKNDNLLFRRRVSSVSAVTGVGTWQPEKWGSFPGRGEDFHVRRHV